MMTKRVAGMAIMLTLIAADRQAHADIVDRHQVSEEAKWLMIIDAGQLRDAPIYQALRVEHLARHEKQGKGKLKAILGIDSWDDVKRILFYGKTHQRGEGVLIFTAPSSDRTAAIKVLENKTNYVLKRIGEHDVHTWTYETSWGGKKQHTVSMAFLPDNRIVMVRNPGDIDSALDVLDGKSPSLAEAGLLNAAAPNNYLIFMEAAGGVHADERFAMLRQAEHVAIAAVGSDEATILTLDVRAPNAESATHIKDLLLGLRAMTMLRLAGEQKEDLQKALKDFQIEADGQMVHINWSMPNELAMKLIKCHWKEKCQRKAS